MRLSTYVFFLKELYHHYNDVFYILVMPHWNWFIALILFLSFWLPLTTILLAAFNAKDHSDKRVTTFVDMFVLPRTTLVRKLVRLITTNVIHLMI